MVSKVLSSLLCILIVILGGGCPDFFAPQVQLLETAKSVGPEALFKQVVKFEQIDPLWSILGENKGGPYCRKSEIT